MSKQNKPIILTGRDAQPLRHKPSRFTRMLVSPLIRLFLTLIGLFFLSAGLGLLGGSGSVLGKLMALLLGSALIWRVLRDQWIDYRTRNLLSTLQLSNRLGRDADVIAQIVRERDIPPRVIVNAQPYYAEADFAEALTLLRGSVAPAPAPETLLRAAQSSQETPQEQLLRPHGSAEG
jgi:hypothetical protein